MPYAPEHALEALDHFLGPLRKRLFGKYGFCDAFCEARDWYAPSYLAIDQGPIIIMIENYRTGLLWKLFMGVTEIRETLRGLFREHATPARLAELARRAGLPAVTGASRRIAC